MPKISRMTPARCVPLSLIIFVFLLISSIISLAVPSSPVSFTATAIPGSKVVLSWKASPDQGIAGYNVYRKATSEKAFKKLNATAIKGLSFEDKAVALGQNYSYTVRAVDGAGILSADSNVASAPNIIMSEKAVITHNGKTVKSASPGDSIAYIIEYTNKGYGPAKDVAILHSVPKGTTILSGSAVVKKGPKTSMLYFNKKDNKWVDTITDESNISKVKFVVADQIPAVGKGSNGVLSFKVVVGF
jgi:uncharacterized repeat protein (TIGR01451 family)